MPVEIQLDEKSSRTMSDKWNALSNSKNRSKNYYICSGLEDFSKFDKHTPRLQINYISRFFLETSAKIFSEAVDTFAALPSLKGVVSRRTIYRIFKKG